MRTINLLSKIRVATVLMLLTVTSALFAQQQQTTQQQQPAQNTKKDKIEVMHTAYITEKINLTPEQSEKFWPIYNQYRQELEELQKQRRANAKTIKDAGGIDNMKDEDVQKLIENEIDIKSRELDIHKKYIVKFQEAITLKQVAKLFAAEEQFKVYLLNQLKAKKAEGQGNGNNSNTEFVPQ